MTTYVYNTNPISTILFKGGHIEIKPQSYVAVQDSDVDSGIFKSAQENGQVALYQNVDDIPVSVAKAVEIQLEKIQPTLASGMTENELKEFLEKKKATPEPPKGKVTLLGQPPEEVVSEPAKTEEVKTESVATETVTETVTEVASEQSQPASEPKVKKGKK